MADFSDNIKIKVKSTGIKETTKGFKGMTAGISETEKVLAKFNATAKGTKQATLRPKDITEMKNRANRQKNILTEMFQDTAKATEIAQKKADRIAAARRAVQKTATSDLYKNNMHHFNKALQDQADARARAGRAVKSGMDERIRQQEELQSRRKSIANALGENLDFERQKSEQANAAIVQSLKSRGEAVQKFRLQMKKLSFMFLTMGLSMLFAGMALKRFGTTVLRSLVNTFKQATEGSKTYARTIGKLEAAWSFLKFTIMDTFMQTKLGTLIIEKLIEKLNELSEWIQDHPNLAIAIVGGSAGLVVLGTAGVIIGQLTTGLSALWGTLGRFAEVGKGSTMKGVKNALRAAVGIGPTRTATGQLAKKKPGILGKLRASRVGVAMKGATGKLRASRVGQVGTKAKGILGKIPGVSKGIGGLGRLSRVLFRILKVFGKIFLVITIITAAWDFFTGVIKGFTKASDKANKKNENFNKGMKTLKAILKALVGVLLLVGDTFTLVFTKVGELVGWILVKIIELVGWLSQIADNKYVKGAIEVGGKAASWVSDMITPAAQGGIVTSPTTALIGEGGPEAIIPLARGGQTNNMGGVNVTVNVSNPGASAQQIGSAVIENIQRELRRSGLGSGL